MPLPEPILDTRTYRDLLEDALARVPVHTPEWTNLSPSDPGVTLLQLFAFMSESVIYRTNRIPTRIRQKFLRLLGIGMRPAIPAQGLVELTKPQGTLEPVAVAAGTQLRATKVPFTLEHTLQVLPIETRCFYKQAIEDSEAAALDELYSRLYEGIDEPDSTSQDTDASADASNDTTGSRFAYYRSQPLDAPSAGVTLGAIELTQTIDGSLWLALLSRPQDQLEQVRESIAGQVLSVGVMPALDTNQKRIHTLPTADASQTLRLIFELPEAPTEPVDLDFAPVYRALQPISDVDLLDHPGVVELQLPNKESLRSFEFADPLVDGAGDYPPRIEDEQLRSRLITWLRIRRAGADNSPGLGAARLSWIGINAARVVQRTHVRGEVLPPGTGEPDQSAVLVNTPIIDGSVQLSVNGELWQQVDDLETAAAEVEQTPRLASLLGSTSQVSAATAVTSEATTAASKVFTIDPESGVVTFGNGLHGTRPPRGAIIQVSYDYGGGTRGVVGIDSITSGENLPRALKVRNPVPTWGGSDAESVQDAERLIPSQVRHGDRLVSAQDWQDLLWRTPGVELGRVDIKPLLHPDQPQTETAGVVTVIVLPRNDPLRPNAPEPDRLFLETVCQHIEPRRLLTTEVYVRGPRYVDIWVSVGFDPMPGADLSRVKPAVERAVQSFLSPFEGGFDQTGWPLGKAVEQAELLAAVARVMNVAQVNNLLLSSGSADPVSSVELQPLELPRLNAVAATVGAPLALNQLLSRGGTETGVEGEQARRRRPIPVAPRDC